MSSLTRFTARIAALATALTWAACASASGSADDAPRETEVRIQDSPAEGRAETIRLYNESSVSSQVVAAPVREVWQALLASLEEMEIPVSELKAREGLVGNEGFRARRIAGKRMSTFLDCGTGLTTPNADRFDVTLSFFTTVRAQADGSTRVVTDIDAYARPRDVSGNAVHCVSTGRLERLIGESITARIAGGR